MHDDLQAFYSERFGAGNLVMLKDSNDVERDALDAEKAYIQITYVEPYFDLYEYEKRKCFFDLNYGLSESPLVHRSVAVRRRPSRRPSRDVSSLHIIVACFRLVAYLRLVAWCRLVA